MRYSKALYVIQLSLLSLLGLLCKSFIVVVDLWWTWLFCKGFSVFFILIGAYQPLEVSGYHFGFELGILGLLVFKAFKGNVLRGLSGRYLIV